MITIISKDTGEPFKVVKRRWNRNGTEYLDEEFDSTFDPSLAMDNVERILFARGEKPVLKRDVIDQRHYGERNWNYSWCIIPKPDIPDTEPPRTGDE